MYHLVVDDGRLTEEILQATAELIDALHSAGSALNRLTEGVAEIRVRAERGEDIEEILRSSDLDEYRKVVDEGIDNFEAWRRIARGTAIRAAVAAGMTLTDIAQEFGFSRTYARRLAGEPPPSD